MRTALVYLSRFAARNEYLKNFNGRNSAAYEARKAKSLDYYPAEIDRNDHIDELHEINTSVEVRKIGSVSLWSKHYDRWTCVFLHAKAVMFYERSIGCLKPQGDSK